MHWTNRLPYNKYVSSSFIDNSQMTWPIPSQRFSSWTVNHTKQLVFHLIIYFVELLKNSLTVWAQESPTTFASSWNIKF